ncbi:MAG: NRDE family protein [Rhodospirillaceae bacterium]|nr:NRDE family protein [Rhodospirillaceae bacterium]
MCTVVILRRPEHDWPILIGANRDEMIDRPWRPPGRHWPDRPNLVAGLDVLAGGSWMGVNDEGVAAMLLNRVGTLGPLAGKRSRGELVLEALDHADAIDAVRALSALEVTAYRPFNLMVADNRDAFWLRSDGESLRIHPLGEGLFMISARELNDPDDSRIQHYLPLFEKAPIPEPDLDDWRGWRALLGETGPLGLNVQRDGGFGTRNASLLALPSVERIGTPPRWLFAPGPPDTARYAAVSF